MKKQNQGVTLIALVITIIVLLILAGVSMNVIFGDNNLFEKAQQAKDQTQNAVQRENDELGKIMGYLDNGYIGGAVRNGSWNGTVNTPKTDGTGLKPVYWNETNSEWVELTNESSQTEWNQWYDYANNKWANAKTADGSMWVWIPRYAYKIESGLGTSTAGTISIEFLQGTTNKDKNGAEISTTYPTVTNNAMNGYYVHPAFRDGTSTGFVNGEWNKELPGFWVAKYAAGFQNATAGEATKTVVNSDLNYTTTNGSNFLTATLTTSTKLSYPVFKANTYAYNMISVGDAFLLSKEIDTASMYGLSNVDSHLQKNSEWGAVAYLTQSSYGRNGAEVTVNARNLNNTIKVPGTNTNANVYAVTSYGPNNGGANNVLASSTGDMTGVFDLSGCVWERTAGFYEGGQASTPAFHTGMANTLTRSGQYVTTYSANNKKGDATNEVSTGSTGSTGWNGDYSNFVTAGSPVFIRGGNCNSGDLAGVFTFISGNGGPYDDYGFRVCLAF